MQTRAAPEPDDETKLAPDAQQVKYHAMIAACIQEVSESVPGASKASIAALVMGMILDLIAAVIAENAPVETVAVEALLRLPQKTEHATHVMDDVYVTGRKI